MRVTISIICVFLRKTRGEPSAQAGKEEEGQERDMRPLCRPLYAKDFISCLCNTFCEKNFDKGLCDGLVWKYKQLLYTLSVSRWIIEKN